MKFSLFVAFCLLFATAGFADERSARGQLLRKILLETLDQAHQNEGEWPEKIAAEEFVYTKPAKFPEVSFVHMAAATVVLREKANDGAWLGFGDGHLEYATAEQIAAADNQQPLAQQALDYKPPTTQTAKPSGEMKVRVIDPDGKPVAGAAIGVFANFGDVFPQNPHARFATEKESKPLVTDNAGEAVVDASHAFAAKFFDQPTSPLWIIHESLDLVASEDVSIEDFRAGASREIRLASACHVKLEYESLGLSKLGREIKRSLCLVNKPGRDRYYTLQAFFKGTSIDLPLPPGDWCLTMYATDTKHTYRYVHIAPGTREMKLHIDLPPGTAVENFNQPAPELVSIKGWKNGGPVTLAQLRGKVIILDFWGYWCNPCCEAMPGLMKIYDEFHDRGVEIIAVHDDSVGSIAEMDAKLTKIREKQWGGRDLPFIIALDGGGETRIKYSAAKAKGATTAAYGVTSFPTTLIIGKDGKLRSYFDAEGKDARAGIEKLLNESP